MKSERIDRVIFEDEYFGVRFKIKEYGLIDIDNDYDCRWYCAYVQVPKDKLHLDTDELEVHGGITYNKKDIWGWDYNHGYDMSDTLFKTKLQLKPIEYVIDFISMECQEFIRRYLI